jgi:hypothetical protein
MAGLTRSPPLLGWRRLAGLFRTRRTAAAAGLDPPCQSGLRREGIAGSFAGRRWLFRSFSMVFFSVLLFLSSFLVFSSWCYDEHFYVSPTNALP